MPRKSFQGIVVLFFLLSYLNPLVLSAQVHLDFGQIEVQNFSPKDYKSHPQNWAITQDKSGVMYFGNNFGILVFDGITWDIVKVENESAVRALDVSPKGKVFAGASGDFGYIDADDHGRLNYHSLSKLYNLDENTIGDVNSVNAFDQGVYFMTDQYIYFYNGTTLKLWETESSFQAAFMINGSYMVNQMGIGLCKMINDTLKTISKFRDFRQNKLYDIIPYNDKEALVLTEKNSFQNLSNDEGRLVNKPYLNKMNEAMRYYNPYNGAYLKNGFLSVGTWGNGLVIIDDEGDIVQRVNSDWGLDDEVITDQFIDRNGNLWISTSNGISKVTIDDHISLFKERVNVNETVEKIVRFNDRIFLATHTGLYSWEEENKAGTFMKVSSLNSECWDILPVTINDREVLLVAGNNAVYQIDEEYKLQQIITCLPWTFHQLDGDPNTIFVGLDDGLMCLKYQNDAWMIQNHIGGISNTIYSIDQSEEKRLWLGTLNNGVIRMDIKGGAFNGTYQYDVKRFGEESGLPEGGVFVTDYVGGMLFGTSNGIFEYRLKENIFIEETVYKKALGKENIVVHRISEDSEGKLWTSGYWNDEFYLGYFERKGSLLSWVEAPFRPVSKEVYHSILHEENGICWLGGPDGLVRYRDDIEAMELDSNYNVLIRKVILNKDSIDFAGNVNVVNYLDTGVFRENKIGYPYDFNSVSFVYSSQYHKHPEMTKYSHKLEGFEDKWSDWDTESKAIYTNLREGWYKFKVKSRNVYGIESEEAEYAFFIRAPWYRTWWAYFIYVLISIVVVYFVIQVYTKRLKEIIKERTAEVVLQKEEIEKQKDAVESQRRLLEVKNADITSSINYAKRLQEALLPNHDLIDKYFKENFILYKPKDIVSGDFYWMEHVNGSPGVDMTLFATVDCTGHGVPGAFVSVVGNGGLQRAVNEFGLREPAAILEKLNEIVVETLSKDNNEVRDGMDISLCRFDFNKMELQYAGANNSVYILRKNIHAVDMGLNGSGKYFKEDLFEIKANKQPVGYYEFHKEFANKSIKLEKGDVVYLFSDGYTDQFGGPDSKKYNVTRFKNFLLSIYEKPMSEQRDLVEKEFMDWKGDEDQIDDVIVAGIKV